MASKQDVTQSIMTTPASLRSTWSMVTVLMVYTPLWEGFKNPVHTIPKKSGPTRLDEKVAAFSTAQT